MKDRDLRSEIIQTCLKMTALRLNHGAAGNISVRTGERFLITPSSLPYEGMTPEDIVEMEYDGSFKGRRPSSEWRFHRDILRQRPDVNVVLHCHSVHATTLACHHKSIPAFHYMVAVAGGTTIRCSPYATFGTQALSDAALAALDGRFACLLGQHGQISLGKSLDNALWLANEVEMLAQLYLKAQIFGEPPVLDDQEMLRVHAQMERLSYGHAPEA